MWPNPDPLRDIKFQKNQNDLEVDFSRSLKVKANHNIGLPIYCFLLKFTILAHSRRIRLPNLSDIDFDLSKSLKVKPDCGVGLPVCDLFLVFNSNAWPNFTRYQNSKSE